MEQRKLLITYLILFQLTTCRACQMEGISNWFTRVEENVLDTKIGIIMDRSTTNIDGISNIAYGEGLNQGPYMDIGFTDSRFTVATNSKFAQYEENETSRTMRVTVTLNCAAGSSPLTRTLVIQLNVIDTNNNAPQFLPSNSFEFTVIPPLPPGFLVTGCENQIIAKDIDLTTQRVDFTIDDNPYFEILYDKSTALKEYSAKLRAKTFIRTISETLTFNIRATDVDETGNPPQTSVATVRIVANTDFQLPEELEFSKAFYTLNYTVDHTLVTDESILLTRGFDDKVQFNIEGDYATYFEVELNANEVKLKVKTSLPLESLQDNEIYVVLRAEREYTSGRTATLIIQLPEARTLSFESLSYKGKIDGNNLEHAPIVLSEGYKEDVIFNLRGDFAEYFSFKNTGSQLTLSLKSAIPEDVIKSNKFITLEVIASGVNTDTASAIIVFDIIKEDFITPVFSKRNYEGTYVSSSTVRIEEIALTQGYDETVSFELLGEHAGYFALINNEEKVSVSLQKTIPETVILSAKVFVLNIVASKPNTVGSNAVLVIQFPKDLTEPTVLRFSKNTYSGVFEKNTLTVEKVVLETGYTTQTRFSLSGEYSRYFAISKNGNELTIITSDEFTSLDLKDRNYLTFNVNAERNNAVPITSTVVINLVKEIIVPPKFDKSYYTGKFTENKGLEFDETLKVTSGYDETVSFKLEGDMSQWFYLKQSGNSLTISIKEMTTIPQEVIENNRYIIFTVLAIKPNSPEEVAVVAVELIQEELNLKFDQSYYVGSLSGGEFSLKTIKLIGNYNETLSFTLQGDLANYFSISPEKDEVIIAVKTEIPEEKIPDNGIITLELSVNKQNAMIDRSVVILDVIKPNQLLTFSRPYYTGRFTAEGEYTFTQTISLSEGYDDSVEFNLEGESAQWFYISQNGNSLTINKNITNSIPEEVLKNNNHILFTIKASKPHTQTAYAVIAIELIKDSVSTAINFDKSHYIGSLKSNELILESIELVGDYDETYSLLLVGDLANYFSVTRQESLIKVTLEKSLPDELIPKSEIITLEIRINKQDKVMSRATIILDAKRSSESLKFSRPFYTGRYTSKGEFTFTETISLIEGYDSTVEFVLEGESSQWFYVTKNGNSATIHKSTENPIPDEVMQTKNQILFTIVARKPNTKSTQSVISIELLSDSNNKHSVFEKSHYIGSLENNELTLDSIRLSGNYDGTSLITLHGDYATYFEISRQGSSISVILLRNIPLDNIPSNEIITLEIRISTENNVVDRSTIVLKVLTKNEDKPVQKILNFERTYYTGNYTLENELVFVQSISLSEGYDKTVIFSLEGDYTTFFQLKQVENEATLSLPQPLPPAIVNKHNQLIFVVRANRSSDGLFTRSTIVITINQGDEVSKKLSFEKQTYIGIINSNNDLTLETIVLSEGFDSEVKFNLIGDLKNYFTLSVSGNKVSVVLQGTIPEENIPSNRLITLEIHATAPNVLPAYATLVIKKPRSNTPQQSLQFDQAYYTGTYAVTTGLVFKPIIRLLDGYNEDIQFSLDGDDARWFEITQDKNTATLRLLAPLPENILKKIQLIFVVQAQRKNSDITLAQSVIVIEIESRDGVPKKLNFEKQTYIGTINSNNDLTLESVVLSEGFASEVKFDLIGDLKNYFSLSVSENKVSVALQGTIPEESIPSNRLITLEIYATAPNVLPAYATLVIKKPRSNTPQQSLQFDQAYYTGTYAVTTGLVFKPIIRLLDGYNEDIQFSLDGDDARWFEITQDKNTATLRLLAPLPENILKKRQLIFVVQAQRKNSDITLAQSVIVIEIESRDKVPKKLNFEKQTYIGTINSKNDLTLESVVLSEGFDSEVKFDLIGDLKNYFNLSVSENKVSVALQGTIPEESIPSNRLITLEIYATAPNVLPAYATLVIKKPRSNTPEQSLQFDQAYYTGTYAVTTGLVFNPIIRLLDGYNEDIQFSLDGDDARWFEITQDKNTATLRLLAPLPENILKKRQLIFVVQAQRKNSDITLAQSVIVIEIESRDKVPKKLNFEKQTYIGTINSKNDLTLESVVLSEGFDSEVKFDLIGDLKNYFNLSVSENKVSVVLQGTIPEESIPSNRLITLEIHATAPDALTAYTTLVIKKPRSTTPEQNLQFDQAYYTGTYAVTTGLVFNPIIRLLDGYNEDIQFILDGDDARWFEITQDKNTATLRLLAPLPENILKKRQLIFVVQAQRKNSDITLAQSVIVIEIESNSTQNPTVKFDKVLYKGRIENGVTIHEKIRISEYIGEIQLSGEYGQLFKATLSNGEVSIEATSTSFPTNVPYIDLRIIAADANAVLILNVINSGPVDPPSLSFSSPSYVMQADDKYTGFVGRVTATADNGEAVTYSLQINSDHLQERVSINEAGEICLSAVANIGTYDFTVTATTIISKVTASAKVTLSILKADDTITLPPLIVLDRDEEESYLNLVPLDRNRYPNCRYLLTNRWPEDQQWLYVDADGLHSRAIDREHPSIASMPVSQIQVEITLNCEASRNKRSVSSEKAESKEYGTNKWILAESIAYSPRRTVVNLIVNDINDNAPVFVGKNTEPLVFGYPTADIEEVILPRALAELKATDADIGQNAELRYSSEEDSIFVSPTTGSVHVRNHAILKDNTRFVINVADRNGTGLTSSIDILVKILDRNKLAVVTVKNAFLEDEENVLKSLSEAIGYEIKTLRTMVVFESADSTSASRLRRELTGPSLRLYVYGLENREPVDVNKLTEDLGNNDIATVSIARVLSLEDHLESLQICPVLEREIGLLAATIVLAILLLIITLAIALWFFFKRKGVPNYDQFSDRNSIRSRNESVESPKVEAVFTSPRANLDEIRKSGKRLQEMLDSPTKNGIDKGRDLNTTTVDIPETETKGPIIIQSIDKLKDNADDTDDDDEFGEKERPRRKSVVTFNENVEKIIHLEDGMEEPDLAVQKL